MAGLLAALVGCGSPDLGSAVSSSSSASSSSFSPSADPESSASRGSAEAEAEEAEAEDDQDESKSTDSQDPPVSVRVYEVNFRSLDDAITTTGELRADEEVDLRAEENGRIVELKFREGQKVKKGALLVKINDADLVAEQRRLTVQKELAEKREERSRALRDEETVSQEVYEETQGRVRVLDAQLDQVAAEIAKTEIRAPFSGVVGLREVSEGSYITSSTTIARLQNLDPIKLDFAVPEKYVGHIRPGDALEFTVVGREQTFAGKVYAVEPRIDVETRTVQVRARAANPQGVLFPGAFAKVRLVLDRDEALMVPTIALIPGLSSTTVYVAEGGVASPRKVEVGRRTQDRVEIVSGLEAGDQVIVSGIQQVRPGSTVDVVKVLSGFSGDAR